VAALAEKTNGSIKPEWEHVDIYSNINHSFDRDPETLKDEEVIGTHHAWDFCAYLWFDRESQEFIEEVWQHNYPMDVLRNPDAHELVDDVNDKYGYK